LFLTENDRKLLTPPDGRKFDPLVLHPLDPIGETKGVDGELKVGIRGSVVSTLDQMQVIIDPVGINLSG
ncbi:MAG TPA: hypothetical protein DEQ87_05670, partial [Algoriphagus sp.]|nr:hypothetical protein [Algoriphagus sp.]